MNFNFFTLIKSFLLIFNNYILYTIEIMGFVGRCALLLIALATCLTITNSVHFQLTPVQKLYPKKAGDHYVGQRKTDGS